MGILLAIMNGAAFTLGFMIAFFLITGRNFWS